LLAPTARPVPRSSPGLIYTRLGNPTIQALEEAVAELEGGHGAVATATGMAAVSTALLSLLRQGDHIIATQPLYGASRRSDGSSIPLTACTAVHAVSIARCCDIDS
jgi:O-acetylhomoserine/O-acetylserine sulfhydrylase-like pyridoxal-dependent enzyme